MKTANHLTAQLNFWVRSEWGPAGFGKSSRLLFFWFTISSFIQFHLLLLSSIFQLFTELQWPPSLGLPACYIDHKHHPQRSVCVSVFVLVQQSHVRDSLMRVYVYGWVRLPDNLKIVQSLDVGLHTWAFLEEMIFWPVQWFCVFLLFYM